MICPPRTAFDLHKAWPSMELVLVNGAGHSMYEPGMKSSSCLSLALSFSLSATSHFHPYLQRNVWTPRNEHTHTHTRRFIA